MKLTLEKISNGNSERLFCKQYAYEPIVYADFTMTPDEGEEGEKKTVTIPLDLRNFSITPDAEPFQVTFSNVTLTRSVNIKITHVEKSDQESWASTSLFGLDDAWLVNAVKAIVAYDGPFKTAGIAAINVGNQCIEYLWTPYWWRNVFNGQCVVNTNHKPKKVDEWRFLGPSIYTNANLLMAQRKLQTVAIDFSKKINAYETEQVLATDRAYVDTEFRIIYVLVKKFNPYVSKTVKHSYDGGDGGDGTGNDCSCKVVALSYRTGQQMTSLSGISDVVTLSWMSCMCTNNNEYGLHIRVTTPDDGKVYGAEVSETELRNAEIISDVFSGDSVMQQRMCKTAEYVNWLPVKDVDLYSTGEDGLYHAPLGLTPRDRCYSVDYYQPFTTKQDLRNCFRTYFDMLNLCRLKNMGKDVCDDKTFDHIRTQFWLDRMRYGPFNRWNLSELGGDLSFTFKDFYFPYLVKTLNVGGWTFPPKVKSMEGMFENVQNVQNIDFGTSGIEFDSAQVSVANMFAGSSFSVVNMADCFIETEGRTFHDVPDTTTTISMNFDNMFKNCANLEAASVSLNTRGYLRIPACMGIVSMNSFAEACPVLRFCTLTIGACNYYVSSAVKAFANCTELQTMTFLRGLSLSLMDDGEGTIPSSSDRDHIDLRNMFANCRNLRTDEDNYDSFTERQRCLSMLSLNPEQVRGMFYNSSFHEKDTITVALPSGSSLACGVFNSLFTKSEDSDKDDEKSIPCVCFNIV